MNPQRRKWSKRSPEDETVREIPSGGNVNPFQYFCLDTPIPEVTKELDNKEQQQILHYGCTVNTEIATFSLYWDLAQNFV